MKCTLCGSTMKAHKETNFHYSSSGLSKIYLSGISILKCKCGEEEIEIPNIEELHTLLAQIIANQENKFLPEEIRFLRTHLGLSGVDFSRRIGVDAATVSRWENGKSAMGETAERFLRLLILANNGPITSYDFLDRVALKESRTAQKRTLKLSHSHWVSNF